MPGEDVRGRFTTLASHLEVLASESRLAILYALRTPRTLQDIRIGPRLSRVGQNPDRVASRQSVARHVELLKDAGLVHRIASPARNRPDLYVLNHERLFAVLDEMRALARLRPLLGNPQESGATIATGLEAPADLPPPPRLLVAFGRDDGVGYPLHGPIGASWRIGRSLNCEIRIEYDPFLSSEHCVLQRAAEGFSVMDVGSRNGTWVDWTRLHEGEERGLRGGELVTVGRTVLGFQP